LDLVEFFSKMCCFLHRFSTHPFFFPHFVFHYLGPYLLLFTYASFYKAVFCESGRMVVFAKHAYIFQRVKNSITYTTFYMITVHFEVVCLWHAIHKKGKTEKNETLYM